MRTFRVTKLLEHPLKIVERVRAGDEDKISTLQKRQSDSYLMQSIIHIPLQCLRIFIYYRQWTFLS